jgi:two-component system, NtrC family, response regulator AtoC
LIEKIEKLENPNQSIRLLVVSKDQSVVRQVHSLQAANDWKLQTASCGWEAMEPVQSAVTQLLVLDVPRGDADSLHFVHWLHRRRADLPVILLCYPDDAARGREISRGGLGEVLIRPFDASQLEFVIRRHLGPQENGAAEMRKNMEQLGADTFFVSDSLIMQKLRAQAALLAKSDVPVLILGETGTGKSTVACLIHKLSVRSGFKLHRVNCAELPEPVLETELFGNHGNARGASLGKFAAGERGTVLLEEVGELPGALQPRLLRVLQNQESAMPAGGDAVPADVRILAASSAQLDRTLAGGQLREDLYYRLSAFTVHVPPLRQRKDEIATLLRYFMHKLAKHYGLPARGFSPNMLSACQQYSWPGNLKELETFVKRYLVAGEQEFTPGEVAFDAGEIAGDSFTHAPRLSAASREMVAARSDAAPESLKSLIQGIKSEAEQGAIAAALKRTGWNRKAAARLLRVSYRTLLYKIEQYHMRAPEPFLTSLPAGDFSLYEEIKGNGKAS